jgi:hypothetical protein
MTHMVPIACPSAVTIGKPAHAPTPHGPIPGCPAVRGSEAASSTMNGPFIPTAK